MPNLHISLSYQGQSCQFDLIQDQTSDRCVIINEVTYSIVAEENQLPIAQHLLQAISYKPFASENDIAKRMKKLSDIEQISIIPRTDKIGTQTLGTSTESHVWREREEANLPTLKNFLAQAYWNIRDQKGDHAGLKEFLGPHSATQFDQAMLTNDFTAFSLLFDDLSTDDIDEICRAENCIPLGYVKTDSYTISLEDRQNLLQYMNDIGFSGVVHLSDSTSTYCICPSGKEAFEHIPFSMHSISKVLTGVLALQTFPEEAFDQPIVLSPSVIDALSEPVRTHLLEPTLLQIMNHRGGLGDFLGKYQQEVMEALSQGTPLPVINKIQDFLKYAEETIYPVDQSHYSNLGILLVGLAVEYFCNETSHLDETFDEILNRLISMPAGVNFSPTQPENGRFNPDDPTQGMVVGGPAGGYWTTSENIHKFGTWLQQKCRADESFISSLKRFGTEFYIKEDKEIRHNGNSSSGSALLSTFIESGVTISVLSDQSKYMADKIYYAIRRNIIEQSLT